MNVSAFIRKYRLLNIAWIIIGIVILAYYSAMIYGAWQDTSGDLPSSLRPYLLFTIFSILVISGGIGSMFDKTWAKIILIFVSVVLLFVAGGSILSYLTGLLKYYQIFGAINGYFEKLSPTFVGRIIQFVVYPVLLVISLLTIIQFWGGIKQLIKRINEELWG